MLNEKLNLYEPINLSFGGLFAFEPTISVGQVITLPSKAYTVLPKNCDMGQAAANVSCPDHSFKFSGTKTSA